MCHHVVPPVLALYTHPRLRGSRCTALAASQALLSSAAHARDRSLPRPELPGQELPQRAACALLREHHCQHACAKQRRHSQADLGLSRIRGTAGALGHSRRGWQLGQGAAACCCGSHAVWQGAGRVAIVLPWGRLLHSWPVSGTV